MQEKIEFNPDKTILATDSSKTFCKLSEDFEKTKSSLNSFQNYYINTLFSFLGYNYKGRIENLNILHISAEAWLLGVFDELKKEKIEKVNISYSELLKQIKQIIVKESTFIDNMRLLIGIYGIKEISFNDNEVFKMFLVNIQETKNQMIIRENENLTKSEFQEILLKTLKTAFNLTLNEFITVENDKKSLNLLNLYQEISKSKENKLHDNFLHKYSENKKLEEGILVNSKLFYILSSYYFFCETKFEDLLEEIYLFNQNSSSVIFKIKNLISIKNLQNLYAKYFEILTNNFEKGIKNLKLESVLNFYKNVYSNYGGEKAVAVVKNSYQNSRKWLDNTFENYKVMADPLLNKFNNYKQILLEKTQIYTKVPYELIYERVYVPFRNITVNVKDNSIQFVVNCVNLGKEKTENLQNYITNYINSTYNNIKGNYLGDEPLVKFEYEAEDKNYMSISISRKLMLIDPIKTKEMIKNIYEKIKNFNVIDSSLQIVTYTQVKVSDAKNYVMTSYKRFLDLASEDENESEINLKKIQ